MSSAGTVFHIQRFSIHDGPGIRTTVFLQGCALSCFWCHNPEGSTTHPVLQFYADRCTACGACVQACPHHAHEFRDDVHLFHRERCVTEGACVESCFSQALLLTGRSMTVAEVMAEVLQDTAFYERSGGGVTLSGGEPSLSSAFSGELLAQCKARGIHTAVETCGEAPWASLADLLPVTDLVMMDIKHMVPDRHRAATGKANDRILDNARRLAGTGKPIVFRTPVVPTVNDTEEQIADIAAFIRTLIDQRNGSAAPPADRAHIRYELLTFHRLASDKYRSLGREYRAATLEPLPKNRMQELADVAAHLGVDTAIR